MSIAVKAPYTLDKGPVNLNVPTTARKGDAILYRFGILAATTW